MKRFTDTAKWEKAWFRKLPPRLKCFWSYLCDRCDAAGVWEPDYELASLYIGESVSEADLEALNADADPKRIATLPNGKLFLPRFVLFQCGELNPACRPHLKVIALLGRHGITDKDRVSYTLLDRVQEEEEEEDKEEDKEKEKRQVAATDVLSHLNIATGRSFRAVPAHIKFITDRLGEPQITVDGIKAMIDRQSKLWKGTEMEKFLRPETLFNKTKFASYYDDRNQPTHTRKPDSRPNPRSVGVVAGLPGTGAAEVLARREATRQPS